LIQELLALNEAHRYRLYFNQVPPTGSFPEIAEQTVIPFPRLWTHVRLSREMAQHPPDLLFVPAHVLPLIHPRHNVVTVHDLGYHYYPEAHTLFQNLYLRWSTRYNARTADRILADSEATRNDLIHYYRVPEDKIAVVYPGRDETLVPVTDPRRLEEVRARYTLSESYFLYVGTLHPRKNLVRLVQAFARLPDAMQARLPDLQLVLAGQKGWLCEEIFAEVRRLDVENRVLLTGYVPDEDLPALLSGALAFVFPSLYEGFGLPVLEAMACGTPVICANTSSLPEVAGDAALLVDPLDTSDIAAALARVVIDGNVRHALAGAGFRRVQQFSWRRCAQETLRVLEDAVRAG
jgi:glycosyltransferase involved in cell wall biosynthesis